ncbi:MAG: acyl-CoA thioesterase [Anaerolineae bacterium]|nr:acyl-CoA thioesterase [Anaerolineae bacterium]
MTSDRARYEEGPFRFHHPLCVRYVEVDAQRHVYFGHYLTYFDVALVEYMKAIGYAYQDMLDSGVDMFYVETGCQYRGRARFDDLLHVHARIGHMGHTSFTFEFAIYKQPADELIAAGKIAAVAVDAREEQPVRVPDELREAVARFEGEPARGGS